ncbi:unnamed protein product [Cyclocybe aegerita]|uniref:Uncharacterized protein n=1 Tax=Cyclocybe aegerita TaxID=1973307 RepID=A0A8S0XEU9_CYCAE|nr:unnamed protein product [Cyclocybe aegerita]
MSNLISSCDIKDVAPPKVFSLVWSTTMDMFRSRIFYGYLSFLISTWALSSALFLFFSLANEMAVSWIYFRKDRSYAAVTIQTENPDPSSMKGRNSQHAQTEELDPRTHAMAATQTDLLLDKDSASDALQQKTYASFGAQTSTERLTGSTVAKSEPSSSDRAPAFSSLSTAQQPVYTLRGMVHDNIGALREKTSQVVNAAETPGKLPKAVKQLHSRQTVLSGFPTAASTQLYGVITPPSTPEISHLPLAARIGARMDLDSPEVIKKRHRLHPKQAQQDARDREEVAQFLLDDN